MNKPRFNTFAWAAAVLTFCASAAQANAVRSGNTNPALADPNPVIRTETAKTLAQIAANGSGVADVGLLRRMLRDADPWTRLYAAQAVLAAAKGSR